MVIQSHLKNKIEFDQKVNNDSREDEMNRIATMMIAIFSAAGTVFSITVDELIDKMENAEQVPYAISTAKQTVITPSGSERTFTMKSYSTDNNDKSLTVYESPARVKGEKILSLNDGDDIWTYSPKTRRVRHLATHMKKSKVMGSDFSYEDMASTDYRKKYVFTILGDAEYEGQECYKVQMIPTKEGPDYKKLVAWVNKENYLAMKIDYYDDNGLLKTLLMQDVQTIDGHITPMKVLMKNQQEGGVTRIETLSIDYKEKPADWMFTQEGLKRR